MDNTLERRTIAQAGLQLRSDGEESPHIIGHAAVFNQWARIWGFDEIIMPGAFSAVLDQDVRMLINHEAWPVMGRTTAGTLGLDQDEIGLAIDALPPDTEAARELLQALERGDVNQMSFAFRVGKHGQRWEWSEEDQIWKRYITQYSELADVSVVTYPAYAGTDAQVRDLGYRAQPPQARGEGKDGEYTVGENGQAARIAIARRQLDLLEMEF